MARRSRSASAAVNRRPSWRSASPVPENRHAQRALQGSSSSGRPPVDGSANPGAALARLQVGCTMPPLDGARAHDGDLDHQVVEQAGFRRGSMDIWARLSIGTRPRCRRGGSFRRWPGLRAQCRAHRERRARRWLTRSIQRRMAVSMPSASTSTFGACPGFQVVLVPLDDGSGPSCWRFPPAPAASGGSWVSTKPPTRWLRWRGKPMSVRQPAPPTAAAVGVQATPQRCASSPSRSAARSSSNQWCRREGVDQPLRHAQRTAHVIIGTACGRPPPRRDGGALVTVFS